MAKGNRSFPATSFATRSGVGAVLRDLHNDGLEERHHATVEIALTEVINNVAEHAFANQDPGQVQVAYDLYPGRLDLTITDYGAAFPDLALPEGRALDETMPRKDLPEGGFGWRIIRDLTVAQSYTRDGSVNHLLLRFDLS